MHSKSLSYNFLHLSVQELLAANRISQRNSSNLDRMVFELYGLEVLAFKLYYITTVASLNLPIQRYKIMYLLMHDKYQVSTRPSDPCCTTSMKHKSHICASYYTHAESKEPHSALNPVDYLAIGYFVTSLLSVPSSDTLNIILNISKIVDKHRLKLLVVRDYDVETERSSSSFNLCLSTILLMLRREITMQLRDEHNINYSHQIFEGCQHTSALVCLNLSKTGFQYATQALTTMLQVNKTFTHLDLSKNWNFSDSGAFCVFQGLRYNNTLVHLNLSNVGLKGKEDTAQALTTMLRVNKTLAHLNFSGNWQFSDSGANCIFQGLQRNTSLVHMNLSNTGLVATEDTAQALTTMLQVNKTIKYLDVSVNWTFSDAGAPESENCQFPEKLRCASVLLTRSIVVSA